MEINYLAWRRSRRRGILTRNHFEAGMPVRHHRIAQRALEKNDLVSVERRLAGKPLRERAPS